MSKFLRKEPNILITGTPGTGKSTLAKRLVEEAGMEWINVGQVAVDENCCDGYDEIRGTNILDEDKVIEVLKTRVIGGGKVVEYHGCDFFPEKWFDVVVVLRTENATLFDRLTSRGYSGKKLTDNLESEIFQIILEEAHESYNTGIIHELQSNNETDLTNNINKVKKLIEEWKTNNSSST